MDNLLINREEIEEGGFFLGMKSEENVLQGEFSQEVTANNEQEIDQEMKIEKYEYLEDFINDMSDISSSKEVDAQSYPVCKEMKLESQEDEYRANEMEKSLYRYIGLSPVIIFEDDIMSKLLEHAYKYSEILDSLLKEDMHQHDMLFVSEGDSTPIEFCMKPSRDQLCGEIMKKLAILVDRCGGSMKFNNFHTEGLTNSIKLVNKGESLLDANEDYFYSDYLIDCLQEKKLLDLNNYRANKSKYSDVDVMDILNKKKMWNQAGKTKISDEEISDFDDIEPSTPKKMWKTSKSIYSREEDIKILQYIIKCKAFRRVKSRLLWQEMEKKNVCNDRTWQSMKERLKNIIPKIKTYQLSERNQSALTEGFMNPNSHDGWRRPAIYSSSESENEDVLPANQKKTPIAHSAIDENIDEITDINNDDTTLLNYLQLIPNECENFSDDIVDQHCSKQVTSSNNLSGTCCNSSNLITFSNSTNVDETFQPAISSTGSEISILSKTYNTINESNENFNVLRDVQNDSSDFSTNLSSPIASTSEICKHKYEKSSHDEGIFNGKKVTTDYGNKDIEANVDKSSGSHCDNENDKNDSYVDETDIEDNEGFYSCLPGINILRNDESNINLSLNPVTKMSNKNKEDESQLSTAESQSLIIEDNATSAHDAENVKNGSSYIGCQQSVREVTHEDSNEKLLVENGGNVKRKVSTLKPVEDLSNNNSDKTVSFSSDESSVYNKISLHRRKKETFIGECLTKPGEPSNRPADKSVKKRDDSKYLGYRPKYTLTFHGKYGCKRKLIKSNSRYANDDSKFSIEEDLSIIKYISKYNAIDCINGKRMWMLMTKRVSDNKRTWLSLKDRFNKRILPNIKYYENEGVCKNVIDFFCEKYNGRKRDVSPVEEESDYSGADEVPRDRFYSEEEKQAIVDYIVKTRRYYQIKGNLLYQTMATKMPNERNRTWQSLQNTFKKYIMPNIKYYVKSKEVLLEFRAAWKKTRKSKVNFKRPPAISSESTDSESSDSEASVSVATTSSSPLIRKDKLPRPGLRHIKRIEFSSSSNESVNGNENIKTSSSIQENVVNDSNCKIPQKEPDNIDVNKGRKVVKKRKLFTMSDELYSRTPHLGPTCSRIGNIPHKENGKPSMSSTKNKNNSSKTWNKCLEPMDMEQCSNSIVICEDLSMPAKNIDNSAKTENTFSDITNVAQCTNSAEICEIIHEEAFITTQKETLSRKSNILSASSTIVYTTEPSQHEIMSNSKQVNGVEEKYSSPFKETVLGSTENVKKIISSCKVTIPRIRNEVITLACSTSKDNFDPKNNTAISSSEKKRKTERAVDVWEQNSPSNSASKLKLRYCSNISPGRQKEINQLLDMPKPSLRRPNCEPDTTLRCNLRVRKIKDKRCH